MTAQKQRVIRWREPESPFAARDEQGQLLVHYVTLDGYRRLGYLQGYDRAHTHCGVHIGGTLYPLADSEPVTCEHCREHADEGPAEETERSLFERIDEHLRRARRPQPVAA